MSEKKRLGRPPKKKNPVGRPKGMETVMKEYRQRMLNSPKSKKVLDSLFEVAMDPEHKHWSSATKMVIDRILPAASFDEKGPQVGSGGISINITGVPGVNIGTEPEPMDADFTEVSKDD